MNIRPRAFISYHRGGTDEEIARVVREALENNEIHVPTWRDRDEMDIGDNFRRRIEAAIDDCDYFLFVLSPGSAESRECGLELARAYRLGKVVLPLLVEDTTVRPIELEKTEYCDFRLGVRHGLPQLLDRLRVAPTNKAVGEDPLTRDGARIEALADACLHMGAGIGLEANKIELLLMLENLGLKCVETQRARDIFSSLRGNRSLVEAGKWLRTKWVGE